jgi:hypothetical protein
MRKYLVPPLAIALFAAVPSCWDDAGDEQWVQQAIPTLLGRKPKGSAEVLVLADLIQEIDDNGGDGRRAVTDLLMEQPEFEEYWILVLADALHARRAGGAGGLQQPDDCWDEPLAVVTAAEKDALADHIASPTAADTYATAWNMNDALRAAVVGDDLAVAWLAYLPALVNAQEDGNDVAETADQFTRTYLGRAADCVACHASAYSTVDEFTEWDRHATSPWSLETSITTTRATPALVAGSALEADFLAGETEYADCAMCHDDSSFGDGANDMSSFPGAKPVALRDRVPMLSDDALRSQITAGGGVMAARPGVDVDPLLVFLRVKFGSFADTRDFFRHSTHTGGTVQPRGISTVCGDGIDTAVAFDDATQRQRSFGARHTRSPDVQELASSLRSGLGDLRAELDTAPGVTSALLLPRIDGDVAFAYLVAETIADELSDEISGERLSVDHGFSRNPDQAEARQTAIDRLVVDDGSRTRLSLKSLLRETVLSAGFNRNAPSSDPPAGDAYRYPMLLNPWAAFDPRDTASPPADADFNSQGDAVHRYTPNNLLSSVSGSLGWDPPRVIATETDFPKRGFLKNIGGYRSDDQPGFDEWDLQSLLHWESTVGDCDAAGDDWIEELMAAAQAASPNPVVLDLVEATRDRLLGSPDFEPGELDAIETMAGVPLGSLATTPFPKTNATLKAQVRTELRKYCGAILVSPQYTMAGLPLPVASSSPSLVVCLPGETCTYAGLDAEYHADMPAPHDGYLDP